MTKEDESGGQFAISSEGTRVSIGLRKRAMKGLTLDLSGGEHPADTASEEKSALNFAEKDEATHS